MTIAQLLKIHHEMEERNRKRIEEHIRQSKIKPAANLVQERKSFREYLRQHTA